MGGIVRVWRTEYERSREDLDKRTFVLYAPPMAIEQQDQTSSRNRILNTAVDMARQVGLEGLTIGLLAKEVGMSKAGLFAHFGSKEDLQLATLEAARAGFSKAVVAPAQPVDRGLPRLYHVIMDWITMIEDAKDRGGCFFYAAAAEFDGRPGAVRDRLVEISAQWLDWIRRQIILAQERGHLESTVDPDQVAFELHAYGQQANWSAQLLGTEAAFTRARRAIRERLSAIATSDGVKLLPDTES